MKKDWRDHFDYARYYYEQRAHHRRYVAYVKEHGLFCQACEGRGQYGCISIMATEPPDPCGWCEMTGKITRWNRGRWLRYMASLRPRKIHGVVVGNSAESLREASRPVPSAAQNKS